MPVRGNEKTEWITEPEYHALCNYIGRIVCAMNLRDWDISVDRHALHDDNDRMAQGAFIGHMKRVELTFRADFIGLSKDEKRLTIVHELIHLHTHSLWRQVEIAIKRLTSETGFDVAFSMLEHLNEKSTEELARTLAPLLPEYPDAILKNHSRKPKTRSGIQSNPAHSKRRR